MLCLPFKQIEWASARNLVEAMRSQPLVLIRDLASDVRVAWRGLYRNPAFAFTAIGTLALALGFATAIASLAQAVLLKPLPFAEAGRLMLIFEGAVGSSATGGETSPGTYRDLSANLKSLQGLALFGSMEANVTSEPEPERVDTGAVTPNFFATVGVQPFLGRFFTELEGEPGQDQVVVLSYELWQRRYAGDRGIVGREIRIEEKPFRVVGVLPPGFRYCLPKPELWRPFTLSAERWTRRGGRYVWVTGRLAQGTTLTQVQSELDNLSARYRQEFPKDTPRISLRAVPVREYLTSGAKMSLYFLLAAVGTLLLIACANVAHILLSRSVQRGPEFDIRRALGAGAGRIWRHLMSESLAISVTAAALAVPVANGALLLIESLVPAGMAAYTKPGVDVVALGLLAILATLTTLLSGMLPAVRVSRIPDGRAIGGRGRDRMRGALIVAEVSLALLLLSGAALLFRTFLNLQNVHPGVDAKQVFTAQTWLPSALAADQARRAQFYDQVLTRLRALPGVTQAAYGTAAPTTFKGGMSSFTTKDKVDVGGVALVRLVTDGYFETLGVRLRAGRLIGREDRAINEKVVVINSTLAKRIWPGEDALGKFLRGGNSRADAGWIRVVGIVDDVLEMGLDAPAPMITYFPESQHPAAAVFPPVYLLARGPGATSEALRQAVREVDPRQTVAKLQSLEDILDREKSERRLRSLIGVVFAGLALILACFGIYGVLSFSVSSRSREMGLRIALGASPGDIARMVVGEGLRLSIAGVAIGLGASLAATRYMEALLFQVQPQDPIILGMAAGFLILTALAASFSPARRAWRTDPANALRTQ